MVDEGPTAEGETDDEFGTMTTTGEVDFNSQSLAELGVKTSAHSDTRAPIKCTHHHTGLMIVRTQKHTHACTHAPKNAHTLPCQLSAIEEYCVCSSPQTATGVRGWVPGGAEHRTLDHHALDYHQPY